MKVAQQSSYPVMSPHQKVLGGFPPEMRVRLKYVDTFALDAAAGSLASYQFDMRNMYDPNVTGTGHQPSNFDRWTTIYNAWTVLSTKVSLANVFNSTSAVQPGTWGFLVSKSGSQVSGFSSLETLLEEPYCKYALVGSGLGQTTPFPGYLTARLPSAPWLGVSNQLLRSNEYAGSGAAGPVDTFHLEAFLGAINGNDPGSCPFRIELEFDCVFFMPKITLPS